jgi:flagellin-like protein
MKWQKRIDEEAVSPVIAIILMVAITVVLAGVLYVWVTSLADTEDTVETLNLSADLETDNTNANLTIEQRGGDKITWADYTVKLEGVKLTGQTDMNGAAKPVSETGDKTVWDASSVGVTEDEDYKVQVIDESDNIVWENTVTAKLFS